MTATLNEMRQIDFVLVGGQKTGMGHIMRCAALANAAARRGWKSRAFIDGDQTAFREWQRAAYGTDAQSWTQWHRDHAANITIIDHPGSKWNWLSRINRANTRVVVLDDPNYLRHVDLTICPALHHAEGSRSSEIAGSPQEPSSLIGPRFAILAEVHRATPNRALCSRDKLLLSLGAADPHHITHRVAPVVKEVLENSDVLHGITSCHAVLGPAFRDPGGKIGVLLENSGWQLHRGLDAMRMARLMSESKLAVMGFGTSLTELAWHGTPHLSITHHRSDDAVARALATRGIGRHLGYAGELDLKVIEARFRCALEDEAWQVSSARRAYRLIEGGFGCDRILDRLKGWVGAPPKNASARMDTERGPDVAAV